MVRFVSNSDFIHFLAMRDQAARKQTDAASLALRKTKDDIATKKSDVMQ